LGPGGGGELHNATRHDAELHRLLLKLCLLPRHEIQQTLPRGCKWVLLRGSCCPGRRVWRGHSNFGVGRDLRAGGISVQLATSSYSPILVPEEGVDELGECKLTAQKQQAAGVHG
jgi:hypothetical protein